MTEFENWYNNEIRPYIHNPKDKDILKYGWKAALGWVRDQCCGRRSEDLEALNEKIIKELN